MFEFLHGQADFICFFYGLALITLGCMCLNLHKQKSYDLPWIWLGLFGFVHGCCEWISLDLMSNPYQGFLSQARAIISTASYLLLFEFGRRGTSRRIGIWIYPVIATVFTAAIYLKGIAGIRMLDFYFVCPVGELWAAMVFFQAARQIESKRNYLIAAALALSLHGFVKLLAPAKVFIYSSVEPGFAVSVAGIPLMFFRALFVIFLILFITLFLHKRRQNDGYVWYELKFNYALLAVSLNLLLVITGWAATELSGRYCDKLMRDNVLQKAELAAAAVDPFYISQLRGDLTDENSEAFKHIKYQLQSIKQTGQKYNHFLHCRFVYLMAKRGPNVVFLADAEPKESKEYSAPGQVYDEATAQFKRIFVDGEKTLEKQCRDKWGSWVSVSIPIKKAGSNEVLAVLGLDINSGNWQQAIAKARLTAIVCTAFLSIMTSALLISYHHRKKSISHVNAMQRRFENVMKNCGEIIWELDLSGKFVYVSDIVEKHLGYKAHEVIGRPFFYDYPEEHRELYKTTILELIRKHEPLLGIISPVNHKNGEVLLFETNGMPIIDAWGKVTGYSGTATNITDQIRAEQELIRKEEQFRTLVANIPGAVFRSTDKIWEMQYITDKLEVISGYRAAEFMLNGVRTYGSIVHEDDRERACAKIMGMLESRRPYVADYRIRNAYGDVKWVSEKGQGIYDAQGKLKWIDGVIFDVSDRKGMEDELLTVNERLRHEDALKSELVYTVSHELRTPLTIFRNIVSNALVGAYGPITEKMFDRLNTAQSNVDRLARIVNDFLDLSKLEAGKMDLRRDKLSMQKTVNEMIQAMKISSTSKNVELTAYMPEQEVFANADHDRVMQVLTNLVDNAIKFSRPEGGCVSVRVKELDGEIGVDIEDNGPGIAPDDISKLFNRFVQIQKQVGPGAHGTGLGLAICKQIVERHGGRIWVESTPGNGANFCFVLPKYVEHAQETNAQAETHEANAC